MRTFRWEYNIDTDLAEMVLVWTGLICLFEHDSNLSDFTTPVNFFTS